MRITGWRKPARWWFRCSLGFLFAAGAVFAFTVYEPVEIWTVPTDSMAPSFNRGERVVVERFTFAFRKPARGDVVIFQSYDIPGLRGDMWHVRRVAGVGGDKLKLCDGKLVNSCADQVQNNPCGRRRYRSLPGASYLTTATNEVRVPSGCFFVLGDNSDRSIDSRFWGFLPGEAIKGRVAW